MPLLIRRWRQRTGKPWDGWPLVGLHEVEFRVSAVARRWARLELIETTLIIKEDFATILVPESGKRLLSSARHIGDGDKFLRVNRRELILDDLEGNSGRRCRGNRGRYVLGSMPRIRQPGHGQNISDRQPKTTEPQFASTHGAPPSPGEKLSTYGIIYSEGFLAHWIDSPFHSAGGGAMALVFTFPCGRCGKKYSVYYPKVFLYSIYGTGTPAQGAREDEEEMASGAIDVARRRAEASGNVWVDASRESKIVCSCGKSLDLNLAHHPRVPQRRGVTAARQSGVIAFPGVHRKPSS